MADLVLSDSLVDEYLKYKFNDGFDKNKTQKLLKYILPFPLKNNHSLMQDPAMAMQLDGSDPLIEISNIIDDLSSVQNSRLKLMLVDRVTTASSFTTVNISGMLPEKLQPKYGATYPSATDKVKAQEHIKALLSDATQIKVIDSYIDSQWKENKTILSNMLPRKSFDLTIESGSQISRNGRIQIERPKLDSAKEKELKQLCAAWQVQSPKILNTDKIHDRYIETDKIKILLSSGLYHLSTSSSKDFTYIIELKP